jgi:hyperosmotically inducible protein
MKALWSLLAATAIALTPVGFWRVVAPAPSAAADADNSGRNVRDRGDATLTPMDQGGSEADRTITQEICKAVVAKNDFSTDAKNVKIITVDGVVTLRGPVKNANERSGIATIAEQTAGVKRVDNQLEIATSH